MSDLLIIIPAYNEEGSIEMLLTTSFKIILNMTTSLSMMVLVIRLRKFAMKIITILLICQ